MMSDDLEEQLLVSSINFFSPRPHLWAGRQTGQSIRYKEHPIWSSFFGIQSLLVTWQGGVTITIGCLEYEIDSDSGYRR
jgi:hypothetical protein